MPITLQILLLNLSSISKYIAGSAIVETIFKAGSKGGHMCKIDSGVKKIIKWHREAAFIVADLATYSI